MEVHLLRTVVHLLFGLSGASGLIYQVVWVRQLGLVFGNTVQSAAVVTSVFMAGLGVGALAAGRWIDARPRQGLRAYGIAEGVIAALGLALAWALPLLATLVLPASHPVAGADGWFAAGPASHLVRIAVATVLLAPSTLLMGATLTWLVRHLTATADQAGVRVGWLYGANTLGAALGALATDLWLVPTLGMWGAQMLAAALNAVAGVTALGISGRLVAAAAPTAAPSAPWPRQAGAALVLAGFAAMGLELVWFRFLGGALGPYRGVLSVLLATLLLGLAMGSFGAGAALRRGVDAAQAFAVAQVTLVVTALGGLTLFDPEAILRRQHAVAQAFLDAGPAGRSWLVHQLNGGTIAGLVLLPAVAMGAAFPLANALAGDASGGLGRRTGQLYLSNTSGNVAGALVTGFVLLPVLGLQASTLLLGTVAWLAAAVLRPRHTGLISLVAGAAALVGFACLPADHLLWRTFPANRARHEGILEIREGLEQIVVVTGTVDGPARLWTSGHPMTSTTPHAQRYMRLMAHLPLLVHPEARRVLVIAFGAGNTTHAASLHPVDTLHVADLSRDILELSRHFEHANHAVLRDPRVSVFVDDGRHHLRTQPVASYDLVTLEPPPLAAAGVSSLYAREFYALAATRLAPGGLVAQWLPAYQVPEADVRALVRAFVDVFPDAVLLTGSARELILLGGPGPHHFDPDAVARVLQQRPEVQRDLARIGLSTPRELAVTFAAGPATLAAATRGVSAVTDDHPVLESAQSSHLQQTRLPADLFAPAAIGGWCAACPGDDTLMSWLDVAERLYATEAFLGFSSIGPDATAWVPPPDLADDTLAAIVASEGFTRTLRAPDALALRATELWEQGRPEAALQHLDAARTQAPGVTLLEETAARWRRDW